MMANEHITVDSNSYEKEKIFNLFGVFIGKSKYSTRGNNMQLIEVKCEIQIRKSLL